MENKPSVFSVLGPKKAFVFGIGIAFLIIFSIGFFVLLGLGFADEPISQKLSGAAKTDTKLASPSAPSPSAPQPSGAGDIQLTLNDDDWLRGNKNAKITIVEFSDLECPFCKSLHPTMQQLLQEYPDDVNWVYRHFPLTSLHPKAAKEAEATECAGELGGNDKFWQYLDKIFEVTPSNNRLDATQLPELAKQVGLDQTKFEECLNSGKYASKVQDHYSQATAAGGRGTPYSVIVFGDQRIPLSGAVPIEQFKTIIDSLLN